MSGPKRGTEILISETVPVAFASVDTALHVHPARVLELAYPEGIARDGTTIEAGLHLRLLSRFRFPASVEFSTPHAGSAGVVIHLRWRARRLPRLFPVMEADLSLAPLESNETELRFSGTYLPPYGPIGVLGDAIVGSAVATSTARQFIADFARAIEFDLRVPEPASE
jgi:hypothetical protein